MSDDTPQPIVLTLRIEEALLPDWFEEIKAIAAHHVRRMGVIERPEEWIVQCELDPDKAAGFKQALGEAWAARREREKAHQGA